MRNTLLSLFLGPLSFGTMAQDFATVYVTPPTDGCNGVWAVQITSLYCTPVSPYAFVEQPSGCIQLTNWVEQQGNFLIPLCAMPCSLTVTTGDGVTCSGSTSDAPIGMEEHSTAELNVNVYDAVLEVTSSAPLPTLTAQVVDMDGHVLSTRTLNAGSTWRLPTPAAAGAYVLVLRGLETSVTKRFVVTK